MAKNWVDTLIGRLLRHNGTPVTQRSGLNFGAGFTVTDDPANDRTTVAATSEAVGVAFADHAEFRAQDPESFVDGEVISFLSPPGQYVYSTSSGGGLADDDNTILKLTDVGGGENGRAYNLSTSPVLPTIAALRLAVSSQQTSIVVLNYSSAHDGGGGRFNLDATDTTSTDNQGTTIVAGTLRWKRLYNGLVDPRWFGAKADDGVAVTDAALVSGTPAFTSTQATFTASDVDKMIAVECPHDAATGLVATVSASAATGTFEVIAAKDQLYGTGTAFLTDLFVGMQVRNTTAWGSGVTVIVTAIESDTRATVSARALTSGSGLTLTRYYLLGTATAFTTDLAEGDPIVVNGSLYHVGSVYSNTKAAIYPVPGSSGSGFTCYRKTVFEANILSVEGAHAITLDANAPASVSGKKAYYITDSADAIAAMLATQPTAIHWPGEMATSESIDPGSAPLMISGDGWGELSGQDGFGNSSLSCAKPLDGSCIRVFKGANGLVTTQANYRKLKLFNLAIVGTGVAGSIGLYPTNGDVLINSNEHYFDDVCIMNFDDGWNVTQSEENKAPTPISIQSCRNGYRGSGPSTNSHIAVNCQGCHRGIFLESGTGLTFKGLTQANYKGIEITPNSLGGLEELIFKEIHCEGNQIPITIDCSNGAVSDITFGDGYHDFSEGTFAPTNLIFGLVTRMKIGGSCKLPYLFKAPGFSNDWSLTGVGDVEIDPAAKRVNLDRFNGVTRTSSVSDAMTMTTVTAATFTADNTTDTYTAVAHGLTNGQKIAVSAPGGVLPTGLSVGITYYVVNKTNDTFQLSLARSGAVVAISDNGSGTLSYVGVTTPVWSSGDIHRLTLTGPTLIEHPQNAPEGTWTDFEISQDGTGNWPVTFGSGFVGDIQIDLTAGATTCFRCYHPSGSTWRIVGGTPNSFNKVGSDSLPLELHSSNPMLVYCGGALIGTDRSNLTIRTVPTYNQQAVGVSNADGFVTIPVGVASVGVQKAPPMVTQYGSSWCVGAGAAKYIIWSEKVLPIQSAGTDPDGEWILQFSIDGETNFTKMIRVGKAGIGYNGAAPYTPLTRAGQITDSSTGAVTNAVADVGISFSQSGLNDIHATLLDRINKLEAILKNLGYSV